MVKKNEEVADLIFKQKLEAKAKLKKARRAKSIRKISVFLIVLFTISFYFISDISKVKYINIYNNQVISKDEIIEYLDLNLDSNLLLNNPFFIKYKLSKHPLIDNVKSEFSLLKRYINIEVSEISIFGYRQSATYSSLIMADGSEIELVKQFYPLLSNLLYVEGFNEDADQKRLVESFDKLSSDVLNQISEIHQTSVSYDDKLLELRMNDGNRVYTSFQSVERLNYYFDIILNLKANNSCIYIDEMSGEAYSMPCNSE